jgi:phage baseplate assembly protein W
MAATIYFDNPFNLDGRGRVAVTTLDDHIRDLIYQVLFTAPGERVNLPDFGCGVRQLLFMGNSGALAAATQFLVHGSLQRWLGDLIQLNAVTVTSLEETLTIEVVYTRRDNNQQDNIAFFVPATGQ